MLVVNIVVDPLYLYASYYILACNIIYIFFVYIVSMYLSRQSNGGRGVCETGLWKYSRHPNYFGDLMQWWGIFTACSTVFGPAKDAGEGNWAYATICGPLFLTVKAIAIPVLDLPTIIHRHDRSACSATLLSACCLPLCGCQPLSSLVILGWCHVVCCLPNKRMNHI